MKSVEIPIFVSDLKNTRAVLKYFILDANCFRLRRILQNTVCERFIKKVLTTLSDQASFGRIRREGILTGGIVKENVTDWVSNTLSR